MRAIIALTDLFSLKIFIWVSKPKTIGDIVKHCEHNMARKFKQNEFSGKLARLVRDGVLKRGKNADGQYEYKKP